MCVWDACWYAGRSAVKQEVTECVVCFRASHHLQHTDPTGIVRREGPDQVFHPQHPASGPHCKSSSSHVSPRWHFDQPWGDNILQHIFKSKAFSTRYNLRVFYKTWRMEMNKEVWNEKCLLKGLSFARIAMDYTAVTYTRWHISRPPTDCLMHSQKWLAWFGEIVNPGSLWA